MKDYYAILEIAPTSSEEDIKKSYRRLAHQFHPDMPNGDEARFKEINEAYQVLGNKEKRAQYDFERNYQSTSQYQWTSTTTWATTNSSGWEWIWHV